MYIFPSCIIYYTIYMMKYRRKVNYVEVLPLELMSGGDFDDKAGENIIRVMNMRVAFNNKRVTTLVTNGV